MNTNILIEKSEDFALAIIKLYQTLQKDWEHIISKQVLRSGTSIGANITEANSSQSKKDFYAKMCIAYKELHETLYWIRLLEKSTLTKQDLSELKLQWEEIVRILAKVKITTEKNLQL